MRNRDTIDDLIERIVRDQMRASLPGDLWDLAVALLAVAFVFGLTGLILAFVARHV